MRSSPPGFFEHDCGIITKRGFHWVSGDQGGRQGETVVMMEKTILPGAGNYDIEVDEAVPRDARRIILAMHGFCGSKASRCITLLQQSETKKGIGLVKFDWPAHGKSNAKDRDLTVSNCLVDLSRVVSHLQKKYPEAELTAFATSFGGYITMLYNGEHPRVFSRIILRSPALRFGAVLLENIIDEDMAKQLSETGTFATGFDRMIDVTEEFVRESRDRRLEDIYKDPEDWDLSNVTIIHGDADELVPFCDSVAFAGRFGIELYRVSGADHRYTGEGQLEEAVAFASSRIADHNQQRHERRLTQG